MKSAARSAGTGIVTPKFLLQLLVAMNHAGTALHPCFGWIPLAPLAHGFKRSPVPGIRLTFSYPTSSSFLENICRDGEIRTHDTKGLSLPRLPIAPHPHQFTPVINNHTRLQIDPLPCGSRPVLRDTAWPFPWHCTAVLACLARTTALPLVPGVIPLFPPSPALDRRREDEACLVSAPGGSHSTCTL